MVLSSVQMYSIVRRFKTMSCAIDLMIPSKLLSHERDKHINQSYFRLSEDAKS